MVAWSNPITVVSGTVIATNYANTYIRDNLNYLKGLLDGSGIDTVMVPSRLQVSNDPNLAIYKVAGGPVVLFDVNDYIYYDRAANIFSFITGGLTRATLDSAGRLNVTGPIQAANDANFSLDAVAGGPLINLDAADYLYYDRAANTFSLVIGNVLRFSIDATGKLGGGAFFDSGQVSIATVTTATIAHGLGVKPRFLSGYASVTSGTEASKIAVIGFDAAGPASKVSFVSADATNISIYNGIATTEYVHVYAMK